MLYKIFGCFIFTPFIASAALMTHHIPILPYHMKDTTCLSLQSFDLAFRYLQWKHATAKRLSPSGKVIFDRKLEVEALKASATQQAEIIFSQNGYKIAGFTTQQYQPYTKTGAAASHQAWFCQLVEQAKRAGLPPDYLYRYIDGSNNTWNISPNEVEYIPITPEQSSSGMYSGGEPFKRPLQTEQFAQISALLSAACTTHAANQAPRIKGTAIVVKYVRQGVVVEDCLLLLGVPERVAIDDWLSAFKK